MTLRSRLVAHRGNAAEFRENSLEAIRSALELGVLYIELDVQLSSDGVPVLLHDANLGRAFGVDSNALEMTWAQLKALGVASLAQADDLLWPRADVTTFVELKSESVRKFGAETFSKAVVDVLGTDAMYVVICFEMNVLMQVRKARDLPLGWIVTDVTTGTQLRAGVANLDYVFCEQSIVLATKDVLSPRLCWVSYEVRTAELAKQLIDRGVTLIESMDVRGMLR